MGLDQYIYKTKKNISEKDMQKINSELNKGFISFDKFEEIAKSIKYFNKKYELQEIVFEIWKKKKNENNIDNFNYKFLKLEKEEIEFIIKKITDNEIIESFKTINEELENNNIFFYSSW